MTAETSNTVSVIDTIEIPRGKPVGAVVSPDNRRLYLATGHGTVVSRYVLSSPPWDLYRQDSC